MVKLYGQNIPSEWYDDYSQVIKLMYQTGWMYYIDGYNQGYVGLAGKRLPYKIPRRRGYMSPFLRELEIVFRYAWKRLATFWHNQPATGGVEPPDTGPRSKIFWKLKAGVDPLTAYNMYVRWSVTMLVAQYKPPWVIDPNLWVADTGNHRIMRRNVNNLSLQVKTGSQGSGVNQFNEPWGIVTDLNYLYVADTGNHRIVILDKMTLSWKTTITGYGSPPVNFQHPTDVAIDERYLYITDTLLHKIIVLDKQSRKLISEFYYQNLSIDKTPQPISVRCDKDTIWTLDYINHQVKIFDRKLRLKKKTQGYISQDNYHYKLPYSLDTDLFHCYIADTGNDRIVQLSKYDLKIDGTVGPGQDVDIYLNQPKGVTISGDYVIIADTGNNRLVRLVKSPLTFNAFYGSYGVGDNQFKSPRGVVAELQHYYTTEGL